MAKLKIGNHSFTFRNPPMITAWAGIGGKRESEGPLRSYFDLYSEDSYWGQPSWEQAEKKMQQLALFSILQKKKLELTDIDLVLSGDLLNQCIGSSFPLRNTSVPHLGLYGACSTMAESLLLGAMTVGGGFTDNAVAMTSSHFASSERQYRFPLSYGGQRPPTSQWTVTGAGALLIENSTGGIRITGCTIGTIEDLGICDAANMGAAMAPAALAVIKQHMEDFSRTPDDYDLIVTGDLGRLGKDILQILAKKEGLPLGEKLTDCGTLIYDSSRQDVHMGGSGCGCSALTLCSYLLTQLKEGTWNRILFCGTGALLSPVSVQQGLSIPAVCHAVCLERGI